MRKIVGATALLAVVCFGPVVGEIRRLDLAVPETHGVAELGARAKASPFQ
jgi:hypothetical protein